MELEYNHEKRSELIEYLNKKIPKHTHIGRQICHKDTDNMLSPVNSLV